MSTSVKVIKPYLYPEDYLTTQQLSFEERDNDWAFLVLDQKIQSNIQPLPIVVDCPNLNKFIGIYGYSKDKMDLDVPNLYIYGMVGPYKLYQQNTNSNVVLTYQLDTFTGQSGSPIILYLGQSREAIIGVHSAGDYNSNFNIGSRLTTYKMNIVNMYLSQQFGEKLSFTSINPQNER